MRVIIAGGGIAGLTMANALEKTGIDFVLLEARGVIDPQVGASIGLSAASMRVYDQLGAAQAIMDQTTPIMVAKHHRKDGSLIMPASGALQILKERFGYYVSFLDRQLVLKALADSIDSKEKVLLNKRVKSVENRDTGATVHCEDGTSYDGDVVVGCDGVNSKVRSEMWRIAGETDPSHFTEKERTKMTAEYTCLFGISNPVKGFEEGDLDYTYDKDSSFLIITGKGRRVYWFYFERLPEVVTHSAKDFPRYTQADAEKHAQKNFWRHCNETQTLQDLWDQRVSYTLVAMEEALFEKWSYGRIATIGDSIHKMTANHGQAGNNAVESAVALANQLKRLHDADDTSPQAIASAFKKWQEKRKARIEATVKEAAMICRMQALKSFKDYLTIFWLLPFAAELLINLSTETLIGSEILEFLPLPDRAFIGSCAFNPKQGVGFQESFLKRLLVATPLLVLSYYAANSTTLMSQAELVGTLINPSSIDTTYWLQAFSQSMDIHLLFAIWLIESNRRINVLTPVQIAPLFMVAAQYFGPGVVGPVFYTLYYIFNPMDKWAPTDLRLTNVAYTRTIMPIILVITTPLVLQRLAGQDLDISGPYLKWAVLALPLVFSAVQRILVMTGVSTTNVSHDAKFNVKKDLPSIRLCIYVLSAITSIAWWAAISQGAVMLNNPGHLSFLAGTAFWLVLLFNDLNIAGMEQISWVPCLAGSAALAIVAGPASALGLLWLRREETLASKRHKDAMTKERYAGKTFAEVQAAEAGRQCVNGHAKTNGSVSGHAQANGHSK